MPNNSPPAQTERVVIQKANIRIVEVPIVGTSPYVQNRFSAKAEIMAKQQAGSTANKSKHREAKNFEKLYERSMYTGLDGKRGMPAPAFRSACISACRLVGFKMTIAKLSVFVLADTFDEDGTPLVHIVGEPRMHVGHARNATGVIDLRARAMWDPGWSATVSVQYDADQFTASDVYNLFERVGSQVGVGEGRNDSRMSNGLGWGCFRIAEKADEQVKPPTKTTKKSNGKSNGPQVYS
jgi:hypothetical protein